MIGQRTAVQLRQDTHSVGYVGAVKKGHEIENREDGNDSDVNLGHELRFVDFGGHSNILMVVESGRVSYIGVISHLATI